jgi:hypothetical protein
MVSANKQFNISGNSVQKQTNKLRNMLRDDYEYFVFFKSPMQTCAPIMSAFVDWGQATKYQCMQTGEDMTNIGACNIAEYLVFS